LAYILFYRFHTARLEVTLFLFSWNNSLECTWYRVIWIKLLTPNIFGGSWKHTYSISPDIKAFASLNNDITIYAIRRCL